MPRLIQSFRSRSYCVKLSSTLHLSIVQAVTFGLLQYFFNSRTAFGIYLKHLAKWELSLCGFTHMHKRLHILKHADALQKKYLFLKWLFTLPGFFTYAALQKLVKSGFRPLNYKAVIRNTKIINLPHDHILLKTFSCVNFSFCFCKPLLYPRYMKKNEYTQTSSSTLLSLFHLP